MIDEPGWRSLVRILTWPSFQTLQRHCWLARAASTSAVTDTGPVAGAVGWTYALTLGFALVYLGEHYLVDLLVGFTLTQSVRRLGPRAAPLLLRVSRRVQRLEARAHA